MKYKTKRGFRDRENDNEYVKSGTTLDLTPVRARQLADKGIINLKDQIPEEAPPPPASKPKTSE